MTPPTNLRAQVRRVLDRRLLRRFSLVAVAATLATGLDVVGLVLLVPLVGELSGSSDGSVGSVGELPVVSGLSVGWLLTLVVAFFTAKSLSMAVIRWWSVGVVLDASTVTATRLFRAHLDAPLSFHDRHNTSESVRTVTESVRQFFQSGVSAAANAVAEVATLVVLAVVVLLAAPGPALVGAVYFTAASVLYVRVLRGRTRRHAAEAQRRAATVVRLVQEGMGGLREHRLRGSERGLVAEFRADRERYAEAMRFLTFSGELGRYYLEVLVMVGFGVVAGFVLAVDGDSGLTTLAVLLAVAMRMLPSLSRLLLAASATRVGRAALDVITRDLDDLGIDRLRGPDEVPAAAAAAPAGPQRLALDQITFTYRGSRTPALDRIDLVVEPGTSLGVVGPSGAGKSTLIDVVCGLREPDRGAVTLDGRPLSASSGHRRSIGLVPQDVFVSDATLADNVAFGLPVGEAEVWDALERAQLGPFVRDLPDGLLTVVGERGTRLSGGQRQRLGIARALCARPSVLVLDEATAALDMETEAAVVEAVSALAGDLTLVVVAHRLSTVRHCDRVAYLEGGRLRHDGTFAETAAAVPEFARALRLAGIDPTAP